MILKRLMWRHVYLYRFKPHLIRNLVSETGAVS